MLAKIRSTTAIARAGRRNAACRASSVCGARKESFIKARKLRSPRNASQFEAAHQFQFPQAAVAADVVEECLLEERPSAAGPPATTPRSNAICRRASITAAQSTDLGQRAVQVMHETHFQIASARIAFSVCAQLHEANQPVRQHVHGVGHRGSRPNTCRTDSNRGRWCRKAARCQDRRLEWRAGVIAGLSACVHSGEAT